MYTDGSEFSSTNRVTPTNKKLEQWRGTKFSGEFTCDFIKTFFEINTNNNKKKTFLFAFRYPTF